MATKTTKVKNGTITLPKELKKSWGGAEVYVNAGRDSIFIKRLQPPVFSEMLKEFKKIGKYISKKDVEEAIREVRKKESRSGK